MARIGVFRSGSLGDHLIAVPLYRRLRLKHAGSSLHLICNMPATGNSKLLQPSEFLPPAMFDAYHPYPVGNNLRSVDAKRRLFRRLRLDLLYYLMPPRTPLQVWRDRAFFALAGVHVIGLNGRQTAAQRPIGERDLVEHEADRLSRLVPGIGAVSKAPGNLSLEIRIDEMEAVRPLLPDPQARTVAISIGTKISVNDWGIDKWSALIQRLAQLPRAEQLVFIGAPDEFEYSEALRRHWPRASVNTCGQLPPRASAALLNQAAVFIGHDSGPMHLAGAVNVPAVAIFSSRNLPGAWFPLNSASRVHYTRIDCMGCGLQRCDDRNKRCIGAISVDEVYGSVEHLLA